MPFVTKADAAELGKGPVSVTPYISAEYFELERDKVFLKTWLFAARVEEIPNVGDYLVKEFDVCGVSVLLTRAKDGDIRAFHNVCTHRLAKLVWDERGTARGLTCKYHGWGFSLNGQLQSVPDIEGFYDLDKSSCELTKIHVDIWNGFIFINLDTQPAQTLTEFLGPIIPKLNEHSFDGFSSVAVLSAEVDVNWKPMLDNFQETYHLGTVHQARLSDRSFATQNPFSRQINFGFFEQHRYMSVWGNSTFGPKPVEGLAMTSAAAAATERLAHYQTIRPPDWTLDVHGIFPNLLIEVAATHFYTMELIPISVRRSRWFVRMYFPQAKTPGQRFSQEYILATFRDAVAEDVPVLKTLQSGMASGARSVMHFQLTEAMCRHTYNSVDRKVRDVAG